MTNTNITLIKAYCPKCGTETKVAVHKCGPWEKVGNGQHKCMNCGAYHTDRSPKLPPGIEGKHVTVYCRGCNAISDVKVHICGPWDTETGKCLNCGRVTGRK